MKSIGLKIKNQLNKLRKEEDGMELIQVIMLIGVAAIIMVVLYAIVKQFNSKAQSSTSTIMNNLQ